MKKKSQHGGNILKCSIFSSLYSQKGFTFIEMVISVAILSILASVAMPLSKLTEKRSKEIELRRNLRDIRSAIDQFKSDWDRKVIKHVEGDFANIETGYPISIDVLTMPIPLSSAENRFKRYLRTIPLDRLAPSYTDGSWGYKCMLDEPDSLNWCGDDIYDVYSKSDKTAIDGTKYSDW